MRPKGNIVKRKDLFYGRKRILSFGIREAHSYSNASELVRWVSLGASAEVAFGGWPEILRHAAQLSPPTKRP